VSEADTTPVPVPLGFDNAKRAPIASAVPVDPGQQQISVQVQVAWALSG
jgi:uncharacterized protein YggE